MLVAELLERLRGEGRPRPGGAVDEDRRGAVGCGPLDARLERAAGDVHGVREPPFVPLVPLADIDDERRVRAFEKARGLRDADLLDLLADLLEELTVGRHWYRKYSDRLRGHRRRVFRHTDGTKPMETPGYPEHRGPWFPAGAASRAGYRRRDESPGTRQPRRRGSGHRGRRRHHRRDGAHAHRASRRARGGAAQRRAAARARPRAAHRSGGARAPPGRRPLRAQPPSAGEADLRALPLGGGAGGSSALGLAGRLRRASGARPGPSRERSGAARPRPRGVLAGPDGRRASARGGAPRPPSPTRRTRSAPTTSSIPSSPCPACRRSCRRSPRRPRWSG